MPFAKGNIPWNTGKPLSAEARENLSKKLKGRATWNKGKVTGKMDYSPSPETRHKIGSANRGKKLSPEICKKMSESKKGQNTWSKGRKASEETKAKMREVRKGKPGHPCSEETKEKLRKVLSGRKLSAERIKSISEGHKGLKHGPEFCEKMRIIHLGMTYSDETKKKISESHKKLWENPEHAKKCLCINSPNKGELRLLEILNFLYPREWKFVGDGQVVIAGKCPDFINVNGQKKIIELYGEHWHKGDDPKDREAIFSPYGYKTLVIWGKELKYLKSLVNKIENFYRE